MFAPPPIISAHVFTTLPSTLNLAGSGHHSTWLADRPYHKGAVGSFLEGPAFDRHGHLYCVDIAYGRIFKIDSQGQFECFVEYDGAPNGLQIHRDGTLFITDHKKGLLTVDPKTHTISQIINKAFGEPFKGLNDLVFAKNGDLYFTDQGQSGLQDASGRVFRLKASGELELLLQGIPSPNSLVLSTDETVLFLAVTRANAIWRIPITQNHYTTKVGVFINLSGGGGPDGLAIDAEDNLYVTQPILGCVWGFNRYGEPIYRINSCTNGRMLTNLAIGGSEQTTLFITEATTGSIQCADIPHPKPTLFSHL